MIKENSTVFPEGMVTLRDLTMATLDMNTMKYSGDFRVFSPQDDWIHWRIDPSRIKKLTVEEIGETWEKLCDITEEQTGYDKKKLDLTTTLEEVCYHHYDDGSPVLW